MNTTPCGLHRVIEAAQCHNWAIQESKLNLRWIILSRKDRNKQQTNIYVEHTSRGAVCYATVSTDYKPDRIITGAAKAEQVIKELERKP